jgi:hypothetical protein
MALFKKKEVKKEENLDFDELPEQEDLDESEDFEEEQEVPKPVYKEEKKIEKKIEEEVEEKEEYITLDMLGLALKPYSEAIIEIQDRLIQLQSLIVDTKDRLKNLESFAFKLKNL